MDYSGADVACGSGNYPKYLAQKRAQKARRLLTKNGKPLVRTLLTGGLFFSLPSCFIFRSFIMCFDAFKKKLCKQAKKSRCYILSLTKVREELQRRSGCKTATFIDDFAVSWCVSLVKNRRAGLLLVDFSIKYIHICRNLLRWLKAADTRF